MSAQDKKTANNEIYQFRINLKETEIWRRFLVRSDNTLKDLHYVIQIIMGWTNFHLNRFEIHGKGYTISNNQGMWSPSAVIGSDVKLSDLKLKLNQRFFYEYDFTAGWEFELRLKKRLPVDEKKKYPVCVFGVGASPDEECGGPEYFNALKDKWSHKSLDVTIETMEAMLDDNNEGKPIGEIIDRHEFEQALYWLQVDEYDSKKANKYLKLYADGDDRWRDAFAEIIYFD